MIFARWKKETTMGHYLGRSTILPDGIKRFVMVSTTAVEMRINDFSSRPGPYPPPPGFPISYLMKFLPKNN